MTALFRGRRPKKSQEVSPRSRTPAAHPPSPDEDEDDEETLPGRSPIRRNSRFYRSMRRQRLAANSEQAQSENKTFCFLFHLSILLTTFFGFEWILYVCLKKCIWFHSIWHEDLLVIKASLCHWNCFSVFVLPNVVGLNSGVLFLCVENIVCYGLSSLAQCNYSSLIVLSRRCLSKLKQKLNRRLNQMIKTHYYSITSNVYTTLFRHLWARFLSEYLFIYVLL